MAFTEKSTYLVALEKGLIEGALSEMGYEGIYPMLLKKILIPYWRYIAHVFMFAEMEEIPNVFVEEEHDVEVVSSKPSDEDVYFVKLAEYEDVLTGEELDMDFYFEMETLPVENDPPEQVNLHTTENLEARLEHVKRSVGYPSSTPYFTNKEPPQDANVDLVPRKIRRDPRLGVVIRESETEHVSVTQIQTITAGPTEPPPHIKESIDGSSSHTKDLDYESFLPGEKEIKADKGNKVLPKDEPIDIVKL
ncbi:hypothetical protein R6Q57_020552 [Mikania cordata]